MRKNYRVLKASSRGRCIKHREFQVEQIHMFGQNLTVIIRRRNGRMVAHFPMSDPNDKVAP